MVDHRSESHVSVRCSFRLGAATTTTSACHVPYHSSLSGALTPRPFAGNTRLCLRKTALLVRFMLADWVCESLTGQVESLTRACFFWQSPRLARTHCQNTCRALILVYLALRITAYAPRKEWCAPKGGARLPRLNPVMHTAVRRCAKSTAAAPASARTAGQVAPASAASATRGPALVLPLGCVTSRLRLSCSRGGLTRGTDAEGVRPGPVLAREWTCCPPSSRVLVTQNVLVCSAERACTRERLRYVFNGLTAVARSRLRPGVLDSEKNAVAATSGSKLVSTRSDSALGQPLGQNGNGSENCCCLRSVCGLAHREFMGGAASSRNLSRSISSSTSTSAR